MSEVSIPKVIANQLITNLGITRPEQLKYLKEICHESGATIRFSPIVGSEGRIVCLGDKAIITVSDNPKYEGRTRFSIAHEMGHFKLHSKNPTFFMCTQDDLYKGWNHEVEKQANEFAAELLLPSFMVKDLAKQGQPGFELAKSLAKTFTSSLMPAVFKLIENSPHASACVLYNSSNIMYVCRSKLMIENYIKFEYGQLDINTLAYRASRGKTFPKAIKIPAESWSVSGALRGRYFMEETEYYPGLDIGMSILTLI